MIPIVKACGWAAAFSVGLLLIRSGSDAWAAEPKAKKPKAADATPASARLRVWKDAFTPDRAVRVVIRSAAKKGSPQQIELSESHQFLAYQSIPPGLASVEVFDEPDAKTSVASRSFYLPPDGFFTVLLRKAGGAITIEPIDDTPLPASTDSGEVTVRNFVPDLSSLRIKIGDEVQINLVSPDSLVLLRGLPRSPLRIETSGSTKAGTSISWTNDVDLKQFRKVTVLVYPDSFGRVRPRVVIDGGVGEPQPD